MLSQRMIEGLVENPFSPGGLVDGGFQFMDAGVFRSRQGHRRAGRFSTRFI
jgi:hypothetical protein